MLDTFNIKIVGLTKLPQVVVDNYPEEYSGKTDIVTLVKIKATGTKDDFSTSEEKEIHVPFNKDGEFLPFSDMTEESVIAWIDVSIIDDLKSQLETTLEIMIADAALDNTLTTTMLPWEQV
jgi:hypothetical protein